VTGVKKKDAPANSAASAPSSSGARKKSKPDKHDIAVAIYLLGPAEKQQDDSYGVEKKGDAVYINTLRPGVD